MLFRLKARVSRGEISAFWSMATTRSSLMAKIRLAYDAALAERDKRLAELTRKAESAATKASKAATAATQAIAKAHHALTGCCRNRSES